MTEVERKAIRKAIAALQEALDAPEPVIDPSVKISGAGRAPYGWIAQPRNAEERKLKIKKPMLPNEQEQEIIGLIKDFRKRGTKLAKIAETLNAMGYRTRSGDLWVFQYVDRILKTLAEEKAA